MSFALLFVQVATLGMPASESADSKTPDHQSPRRLSSIQDSVSDALRLEAVSKDPQHRRVAILQLVKLHQELAADTRFSTSRTLKLLAMKLRARLRRVQKELSRELEQGSPGELAGSRGGRAQQANNAQALVELIQTTISPASWDVNGGQSTIVYFAPRHALVVRAPAEVHSRTRRLLRDLRSSSFFGRDRGRNRCCQRPPAQIRT